MIFDWFKKRDKQVVTGEPSDRDGISASRDLSPERCDAIMRAANQGDTADQCRLAAEILEKNWDVFHAIQTRRNAILGVDWHIRTPAGKDVEDGVATELAEAGIHSLLQCLADGLMPGFAVAEILWGPGGSFAGFNPIQQRHFTFVHGPDSRDVYQPLLVATNMPQGAPLDPERFVVHRHLPHSGDPARGGLIRPLAWLHCFLNCGAKNMLGFVERHGMPFIVGRVDQQAWEKDRYTLQNLIRNFGPNGGGIFSKSVELELLESKNAGEIYWTLLKYLGEAITKVVLGQTATAGDGGGWSNDSAQSQVRQDILEADCRAIQETMTRLLAVWTRFNGGPALRFEMDYEPPEDMEAKSKQFQARYEAMGSAIRAGILTATADIEATVRKEMGLPPISKEATAYWQTTAGVRMPITLQQAGTGQANPMQTLRMLSALDSRTLRLLATIQSLDVPASIADDPFPAFSQAIAGELDDDAALTRLLTLLQDDPASLLDRFGGDTSRIADWLASETISATEQAARGLAATKPTNATKGGQ